MVKPQKFKSNDPLQQLLREAMHHQKVQVSTKKMQTVLNDPGDLYKPTSWKPGRPEVLVIHVDPKTSLKTVLGVFQEQLNDRARGSRLIPLAAGGTAAADISALPRVEVHGDYWLAAKPPKVYSETERETQAIRDRFFELLDSYDE